MLEYCYSTIENTRYPPACPFQDNVSFAEFKKLAVNILSDASLTLSWIDVKRNTDYGYYEWLEFSEYYGDIFDQTVYTGGDCVVVDASNNLRTENCNATHSAMCVHRLHDTNRTFCSSYVEICGTTMMKCYCGVAANSFSCQRGCNDTIHPDCEFCTEKYENYTDPTIRLHFVQPKEKIYIVIENSLKLSYVNGDKPIFCFTDVYTPTSSTIRGRYSSEEVEFVKSIDDTIIYSIKPKDFGPGSYWCMGFKYPQLSTVKSNVILAEIPDSYSSNFVLNLTVRLKSSHVFLPYNIHTMTTNLITDAINDHSFKSIRPSHISKTFNDNAYVNISFHITTESAADPSEAFAILNSSLESINSEGLTINLLSNTKECMSSTTSIGSENVAWPSTQIGSVTPPIGVYLKSDGSSITRSCLGSFQTGAVWSEVEGTVSRTVASAVTKELLDLVSSNKPASERNSALKLIFENYNNFEAYDVYLVAQIFESIVKSNEPFDMEVYLNNMDSVMDMPADVLWLSQITMNATDIILYNLDLAMISSIKNNKNSDDCVHNATTITSKNIMAQVVNLKANSIIGVALYENQHGGEYLMDNIIHGTSVEDIIMEDLIFAVFLPPNLLQQILYDQENETEINVVMTVFLKGVLFNSKNTSKVEDSLILSMFVSGFDAVYLSETIPIIFKPIIGKRQEKHCGYWKYGMEMWTHIYGSWNVDERDIYDLNYSMCNFTHMTHFALLVNGIEDAVLNYISIVGCVLSILGILGVFATACVSKSWREGSGTKILLNYCTAILMQMVMVLVSDLIENGENTFACTLTGMMLHYTIIAQFLWMLIISYLQYRKFVQVLVQEPENLIMKSCLFAWLTPFSFLIIISSIDIHAYNNNDMCYLTGISLYLGLFLPISVVICINVIVFILIFKSVLYRKAQAYGVNKKLLGLKIKLAIILFFLMGFSWIFGLFAGLLQSLFLSYIFSLTATIQGLVMYLYFVICNKSTRNLWTKKINQLRSEFSSKNRLENEDTKSNSSSDDFKLKK